MKNQSQQSSLGQHSLELYSINVLQKQAASLMEQDSRLAHYVGLFLDLGLLWGYLATSGAKYVMSYSCSATLISYKSDKISRLSCLI